MFLRKTVDHAAERAAREFQTSAAALLRVDGEEYVRRLEGQALMTRDTIEGAALLVALGLATLAVCILGAAMITTGKR